MASSNLATLQVDPKAKPPGMPLIHFALAMLILTLIPGAAGGFFGMQTIAGIKNTQEEKKDTPPAVDAAYTGTIKVKELPSIVTNLSGSEHTMIRLQASILFDTKVVTNPDALASQIADDILAFLTTISTSQIEGASGLQHLREDLNDRARVRSEGRIRDLIIETLVIQ